MKKRGKEIKQNGCVIPLGIKRTKYELSARAAMLAIERGVCNEQNIVDVWVLADLCDRLNKGKLAYIDTHANSVKKLTEAIHGKTCDGSASTSVVISAGVLIDWIGKQSNKKIMDIALQQIKQFC